MEAKTVTYLSSDRIAGATLSSLREDAEFHLQSVEEPGDLSAGGKEENRPVVVSLEEANKLPDDLGVDTPLLLLIDAEELQTLPKLAERARVTVLDSNASHLVVHRTLQSLFRGQSMRQTITDFSEALQSTQSEIEVFSRIGMALGSERDTDRLLDLILTYARKITNADSGSLYIIREEREGNRVTHKSLYFANTQSDTLSMPFQGTELEISERSIAGHVALHGGVLNLPDVYDLPAESPYHINPDFDRAANYRTLSMLALPMRDNEDRVIGVLQLINKKKRAGEPLTPISRVDTDVIPFTQRDEQRALAFGGQAAVALENSRLYAEIERLFESFIRASVHAIEARDPITSGHTERVTQLSLALAEAVHTTETGAYGDVRFSDDELRELRYAGLLHDFGKIGVREAVLGKAEKLHPGEWETLRQRFEVIRESLRVEDARARLEYTLHNGPEAFEKQCPEFERALANALAEIDDIWRTLEEVNKPALLPTESSARLDEIAQRTFRCGNDRALRYLTDREHRSLAVERGSLTPEEIAEIRSHILHTRRFLEQIPWSRNLLDLTEIASNHHEMLNGSGYPAGLTAEALPIQARIMAISDIFDALTASDRPYKKAVPVEQALGILESEVKAERLDGELVRIFKEYTVYRCVLGESESS